MSPNYFNNEKLFIYNPNDNKIFKIKHDFKIIKILSLGINIYFLNEKNEIYKVSNDESYTQILLQTINDQNFSLQKVKFLIGGYNHLVTILQNNLIYVYGVNSYNCIGEHLEFQLNELTLLNSTEIYSYYKNNFGITHACCGTYSTIIVINNKDIWFVGKINYSHEKKFTKLSNDENFIVKKISCGFGHLMILTNNGECYGFGMNSYRQLTGDNFIGDNNSPKSFSTLTKFTLPFINNINNNLTNSLLDVFAIPLSHFSVAFTTNHEIFIFGFYGHELGNSFNKSNTSKKSHGEVRLNQLIFKNCNNEEIKERTAFWDDLKNNDNVTSCKKGEISIYGAYSSLFIVDNLKRNIWLCGMKQSEHFVNERIFLQQVDDDLFLNPKEQVLNIACGAKAYGILIGSVDLSIDYLFNNLKKMAFSYCSNNDTKKDDYLFDIDVML